MTLCLDKGLKLACGSEYGKNYNLYVIGKWKEGRLKPGRKRCRQNGRACELRCPADVRGVSRRAFCVFLSLSVHRFSWVQLLAFT